MDEKRGRKQNAAGQSRLVEALLYISYDDGIALIPEKRTYHLRMPNRVQHSHTSCISPENVTKYTKKYTGMRHHH